MAMPMTAADPNLSHLLTQVQHRAARAEVFGEITMTGERLDCAAKASAEPAWYRLELDGDRLFVSLVTANRWLSHSIEADLLHYGDKAEHLVHEELVEHGLDIPELPVEHFRSPEKLFTFRSPLPVERANWTTSESARLVGTILLAYESCFRNLGDMNKVEGDDE